MVGFKFNLASMKATNETVQRVLDQVERRGMKDALMKAATPMVKTARSLAPKRTGSLKKSMGKKGSTNAREGSAHVAIGPRLNYEKGGVRPVRYAHLVEFGHEMVVRTASGKRRVGRVAPRPFMRPAFESNKNKSRGIYAKELGDSIHRQFKRARKGGRL